MSPNSWSAPPTGATVIGPEYSNSFQSNQFVPPAGISSIVEAGAPSGQTSSPLPVSSPAIPDLQNELGPERSLIRQPQNQFVDQRQTSKTELKSILTGSKSGESTSPFRASNFSKGSSGSSRSNSANPAQSEIGVLEAAPLTLNSPQQSFPVQQQPSRFGGINSPAILTPAQSAMPPSFIPQVSDPQAYTPQAPKQNNFPQRYPLGHMQSRANSPQAPAEERIQATESRVPLGFFNKQPAVQSPEAFPVLQMNAQDSLFSKLPSYRPDLGHRSAAPTYRGRDHDSGQKFDFEEKKKDYPPFGEILATGRYFGSASVLFLQPSFQQNSAITQFNSAIPTATFASTESFDFDYETAPRLRFGFESKYGPGIEFDYWQFDQGSNVSSFVSDGTSVGELSTWMMGPSRWTRLEAANVGERIDAIHSIDVETIQAMVFKEIKFPISRLNGMFGIQYASIFQTLDARLTDAGGAVLGTVRSTSDMRAYGPKFKFEYYRPIGHTKLEFMTSFGGGVMFGERDQIVQNTQTPAFSSFGADEYILNSDFYSGIQFKKMFAENRGFYGRLGFSYQSWIGGGTAVDAQDDFGLRGFVFDVGYNR